MRAFRRGTAIRVVSIVSTGFFHLFLTTASAQVAPVRAPPVQPVVTRPIVRDSTLFKRLRLRGPIDLRPFFRQPWHALALGASPVPNCRGDGGANPPPVQPSTDALDVLLDHLNGAIGTLTVAANTIPVSPGKTIQAQVAIPPGSGIPAILEQPVDLDMLLKGVLFPDTVVRKVQSDLPLPVFDFAQPTTVTSGVNVLTNYPAGAKVPGYPGRLCGMLPVSTEIFPTIHVEWTVQNSKGKELTNGVDYTIVDGSTSSTNVGLVIRPPFTELVSGATLETEIFHLIANAKMCMTPEASTEQCSVNREVSTPVPVLKVPIPTMLALFDHRNQSGDWFLVVPENSVIDNEEELKDALETLRTVLNNSAQLTALLPIASAVTDVLDEVTQGLTTIVHFEKADKIYHFENYEMSDEGAFSWGEDADDYFNSVMFMSAGRTVYLYNEKGYNTGDRDEPYFSLKRADGSIGIVALIDDLDAKKPAVRPDTNDAEKLVAAKLTRVEHGSEAKFLNKLSSMKFGNP